MRKNWYLENLIITTQPWTPGSKHMVVKPRKDFVLCVFALTLLSSQLSEGLDFNMGLP